MDKFTHISMGDDRFFAHKQDEFGNYQQTAVSEIRGAAAPPTTTEPGYYLMLGQAAQNNQNGKKPLLFLAEGEAGLQKELYAKLSSDIERFFCQGLYVDKRHENFIISLWRNLKKLETLRLIPTEFTDDPEFGIALIKQRLFDKTLVIPKSNDIILRRELEKMTHDGTSHVLCPLINLIVGFDRHKNIFSPNEFIEKHKTKQRCALTGVSRAAWEELQMLRERLEQEDEYWNKVS